MFQLSRMKVIKLIVVVSLSSIILYQVLISSNSVTVLYFTPKSVQHTRVVGAIEGSIVVEKWRKRNINYDQTYNNNHERAFLAEKEHQHEDRRNERTPNGSYVQDSSSKNSSLSAGGKNAVESKHYKQLNHVPEPTQLPRTGVYVEKQTLHHQNDSSYGVKHVNAESSKDLQHHSPSPQIIDHRTGYNRSQRNLVWFRADQSQYKEPAERQAAERPPLYNQPGRQYRSQRQGQLLYHPAGRPRVIRRQAGDVPLYYNQTYSYRNYTKYYNMYRSQILKRKMAKLEAARQQRLNQQLLLKKECAETKYCLAGVPSQQRWMHDECFMDTLKERNHTNIEINPCSCKLFSKKHPLHQSHIGLVSLAGSGNTWVRGLLEKATGVCTGSMWCDPILRAEGFCAEGLHSALTLVTKNHDPTVRWRHEPIPKGCSDYNKPQFDAVIFLHRNPYDAMVAEWNRALAYIMRRKDTPDLKASRDQHKAYFGEEAFGNNDGWTKMVKRETENWEQMVNHLVIKSFSQPVLVVRYEDVKEDAVREVKKMLEFLKFTDISDKDVETRLKTDFQNFYRNHTYSFDHYTSEQKQYVNNAIRRVQDRITRFNINFIPLEQYIRQ